MTRGRRRRLVLAITVALATLVGIYLVTRPGTASAVGAATASLRQALPRGAVGCPVCPTVNSDNKQQPLVGDATQQQLSGSGPFLRNAWAPGTVVASPERALDVVDSFDGFARYPWCYLSSLDLHDPFAPLCVGKEALLDAMSTGGRQGIDAPYAPRGCDMRWFHTHEMCEILGKFEYVFLIGDSMMRHLGGAMHMMLRRDLFNGARTSWKNDPEGGECTCENAFNHGGCLFNEAFSSSMVWDGDPDSMPCPRASTAYVEYYVATKYPLDMTGWHFPEPLYNTANPNEAPAGVKPIAFVYGQGLWNDLNETATVLWLDQVEDTIRQELPWMFDPPGTGTAKFPRLFITPSAAGIFKPQYYALTQGNLAIRRFELNMSRIMPEERGVDHLGIYNLTVQANSPDGTHAGFRSNIIKAQMVFNWLRMVAS